jgi:DNA polymerase-4
VLRLRFDDYTRATRSHTLTEATGRTSAVLAAARDLLAAAMPLTVKQGLTLLGVALTNLDDSAAQLSLPLDAQREHALDTTVDDVKARFGSAAITRAVLLGRDDGPSVPLLPD